MGSDHIPLTILTETKPSCGRCAKDRAPCIYQDALTLNQASSPSAKGKQDPTVTITSHMHSMAVTSAQTDLQNLLSTEDILHDTWSSGLCMIRMLQHFQSVVSSTLGCSRTNHAMQTFVGNIAWDFPYLMHMVLAISYAHRRRFGNHDSFLAEVTHWRKGLQLHRQNLGQLEKRCKEVPWDAVISTIFLSIKYAFSIDDEIDKPINLLSDEDYNTLFAPMEATAGFRSLFSLLRGDAYPRSQWLSVMLTSDDSSGTFTREDQGIQGIPSTLADLCGIDADSTVDNNSYHKILRSLSPLLELEPSQENFPIFFAFLGRTWPRFRPLIYGKDPRGLLLLSYWLTLLQQLDRWWLKRKTQRLFDLIVAYLLEVGGSEIHALLPSTENTG